MQIKVSFAISSGTAESDALPLLTLEIDAQPSIETLGLGQDLPMEVFTDGDIQLRQWQLSTLHRARHILDWYHLRRRGGQAQCRRPWQDSLTTTGCRGWPAD